MVMIKKGGIALFLMLCSSSAAAEDIELPVEEMKIRDENVKTITNLNSKKLPQRGVLSDSVSGYDMQSGGMWGGQSVSAKEKVAPIAGSVSKLSNTEWLMKVFNNSKEPYQVGVAIVQYNIDGHKVGALHYQYSLDAGKSVERKIKVSTTVDRCVLELERWKKSK